MVAPVCLLNKKAIHLTIHSSSAFWAFEMHLDIGTGGEGLNVNVVVLFVVHPVKNLGAGIDSRDAAALCVF